MTGLDLLGPDHRALFIGGTWREARAGGRFVVHDPADESDLAEIADGRGADAADALDAAVRGAGGVGGDADPGARGDPAPRVRADHRRGPTTSPT